LDVEQPENDERLAWVVAEEGKGLDLVIEVLHQGNRTKDLVDNVEHYAHLGIPEDFVYDRARQQIHGYRLPASDAKRYQRIVPQLGHYRSNVLGLDLAIICDNLRFLAGEATLPVSADLIERLQGMTENLAAKVEQAETQAEHIARDALLAILDVRGLPCSEQARARIDACTDPSTLRGWMLRAKTAASIEEILAEPSDGTE
jgi:hypothetical protein